MRFSSWDGLGQGGRDVREGLRWSHLLGSFWESWECSGCFPILVATVYPRKDHNLPLSGSGHPMPAKGRARSGEILGLAGR